MKRRHTAESAFVRSRVLLTLLVWVGAACALLTGTLLAFFHPEAPVEVSQRTLTFAERVAYQRVIEEVHWRHRIWPRNGGDRPDSKPSLDAVISRAQLEKKVADYLRKSQALEDYWQRPITAEQLQAEMDRMATHSKQPEVLRELFDALGNDPFVIAECLAKPALAERLVTDLFADDEALLNSSRARAKNQTPRLMAAVTNYTLPIISDAPNGCTDDTWSATSIVGAATARIGQSAVWTGSEMIIWGGRPTSNVTNTGAKYNPSTDSWIATATTNAPSARGLHTAVWTGSEMIIWGGGGGSSVNTGGRYNPGSDSWVATSTANAPSARNYHSAIWTGGEMIVWGGEGISSLLNTGGRYDPTTDSWTATSTANAPAPRYQHTAVWTGSEMIVWGGSDFSNYFNSGSRYDPSMNSWTDTGLST